MTRQGGAATSGASAQDNALLASVLEGMNTNLTSVALGEPPPEFANTPSNSNWLYVTHRAGQPPPENVEDAVYTFLIAGAYEAQCAAKGADCLAGYSLGDADNTSAGGGRLVVQPVPLTSASPQALVDTIRDRLAAIGATPSSVTFQQPYGLAAFVVIRLSAPQQVIDSLGSVTVFDGLDLDGWLVQVEDADGNVVYVDGGSVRVQGGEVWAEPPLVLPGVSSHP